MRYEGSQEECLRVYNFRACGMRWSQEECLRVYNFRACGMRWSHDECLRVYSFRACGMMGHKKSVCEFITLERAV